MLHSLQLKNGRGTELLDELASVLSNLYSFNNEGELDFVSTVILLLKYWDDIKAHIDGADDGADSVAGANRWRTAISTKPPAPS